MAKLINTRSPFYVKIADSNLDSAELKLYIYEGVKKTSLDSADLKYTITKSELEANNYVVFEISELVRDYIETKYDGEYDSYCVWVIIDVSVSDTNGNTIYSWTSTPSEIENIKTSGTATASVVDELRDNTASFTSTVAVGDIAVDSQGNTANVVSVDSDTQLTLDTNIFTTGEAYFIISGYYSFLATEGYGYFEEGINPDLDEGLMIPEGNIYRVNDRSINIPVSAETTNSVSFRLNGETIYTKSISDNDNTDQKIQYIASDGNSTADSYIERVLESQGGVFENNTLLEAFEEEVDLGEIDEVYVNYTNATETKTKVLKVKTFDCSKYEPIRVTFVNKFGALQDMYFTRRSNESVNRKTEDYKASVMDFANFSYDTSSHQMRTLNLIGNESITLNTDYIDESCNEHIKQLMLSEQIWMTRLTDEEKIVPLKLKSNSLQLKKSVNDKLIQYTMEFDVAADIINNIR
jgi:hypothetical protein